MSVLARVMLMTCVCAALSQTGQALTCYGCSWEELRAMVGCDTKNTCNTTGYCLKATTTASGNSFTTRGCITTAAEGCGSADVEGGKLTICICNTDRCNGQSPLRASSVLLFAVSAGALLVLTSK